MGGRVTVLPGTAIASRTDFYPGLDENGQPETFMTPSGFSLFDGATFQSQGTPVNPNWFTRAQLVQEGPFGYSAGLASANLLFLLLGNAPEPVLDLRFSKLSMPPECHHIAGGKDPTFGQLSPSAAAQISVRDCAFFGGKLLLGLPDTYGTGSGSVTWINDQFEKVYLYLNPSAALTGDDKINLREGVSQT